jgi:hypothetical protein
MPERVLLLLVPGYAETPKRNRILGDLKDQAEIQLGISSASILYNGYAGYRFQSGASRVDIFELFWQDVTEPLCGKKWYVRLFSGLLIALSWINPRTILAISRSFAWLLAFLLGSTLLAIWFYGTVAVLLVAAGNVALPAPVGAALAPWMAKASLLGVSMQEFWVWAWLSIVLAALGFRPDTIADVGDLFRTFLKNSPDSAGIPVRARFRKLIRDGVSSLYDPANYDSVRLVGQSFGVLASLDAIANGLPTKVDFVTVGGFLAFLVADEPSLCNEIAAATNSPSVGKWIDIYSTDDWFAGPVPNKAGSPKIQSVPVNNGVPLPLRISGRAHTLYFQNLSVLKILFEHEQ